MSKRKSVLLRLDPEVYAGIARWASDDLRSVNAQIEYALRRALRAAGRLGPGTESTTREPPEPETGDGAGQG